MKEAISTIWAASFTLTFFWVINIIKEANPQFKNSLNFYSPIGPLLGVFLLSLFSLFVFTIVFRVIKPANQKLAFWVLLISSIVFFFMTFPPIIGWIINLFH